MPPSPTPTEAQIETTREAARLRSFSYASSLIDKLNDSQWAAQLETNTVWDDARHDDVQIGGRVQIDPAETRALLTNETRERLGLPPWEYSAAAEADGSGSGHSPTQVIL